MIQKMALWIYAASFSFLAYAQESDSKVLAVKLVAPTDDQIPELGKLLMMAVNSKNYLIIAGVSLAIFVWFFNKFILPKISKDDKYRQFIPVLSFVLSIITGLATYILNPGVDPVNLITAILGSTMIASGSWETMAKPLMSLWKNSVSKQVNAMNNIVIEANNDIKVKIEEKKDV